MKLLDLSNKGITSLLDVDWDMYIDGYTKLEGIDVLDLSNNLLSNLHGLPKIRINILKCMNCRLTNLRGLTTYVQNLDCSHNQLTTLIGLTNYTRIVMCSNNSLTEIIGLTKSTIKLLHCSNNRLTSLVGLTGRVIILICNDNQLANLNGLTKSVLRLDCCNNQLTSLNGLTNFIRELNVARNKLTSLDGLTSSVEYLNVDYNEITCLGNTMSVNQLHCSHNKLVDLQGLQENPNLIHYYYSMIVHCYGNPCETWRGIRRHISVAGDQPKSLKYIKPGYSVSGLPDNWKELAEKDNLAAGNAIIRKWYEKKLVRWVADRIFHYLYDPVIEVDGVMCSRMCLRDVAGY